MIKHGGDRGSENVVAEVAFVGVELSGTRAEVSRKVGLVLVENGFAVFFFFGF